MPSSNTADKQQRAGRHLPAFMLFLGLAIAILGGDLALKAWAFRHVADQPIHLTRENASWPGLVPEHEGISLVPSVLQLKLTLNHGAVFGIGQGARMFFIAVTFVALVVIGTVFWHSPRDARLLHISLGLILGGALGNLYDRIVYGAVRDMLYLFPGVKLPFGLQWPGGSDELYPWIFNLADAALCVGVVLILIMMFRKPKPAA